MDVDVDVDDEVFTLWPTSSNSFMAFFRIDVVFSTMSISSAILSRFA